MLNNSGDDSQDVKFPNITFYSLSSGSVGGGTLFEIDNAQSSGEYNFGSLSPFKDCNIVNFNKALKINLYNTLTIEDTVFKGCKQAIIEGSGTDKVSNVKKINCSFSLCGGTSTSFIELDNVEGSQFIGGSFEQTSGISIRIALDQGLSFKGCYINDASLGTSGDFLEVVSTAGFNCDNVSFIDCTSGGAMGDINLIQGSNQSTLTIMDSDLTGATVALDSGFVSLSRVGNVIIDGVTGSDGKSGVATLTTGSTSVATPAVTANSIFKLYRQDLNSSTGFGHLTAAIATPGVNFVISSFKESGSAEGGDLSDVYWELIEPV